MYNAYGEKWGWVGEANNVKMGPGRARWGIVGPGGVMRGEEPYSKVEQDEAKGNDLGLGVTRLRNMGLGGAGVWVRFLKGGKVKHHGVRRVK